MGASNARTQPVTTSILLPKLAGMHIMFHCFFALLLTLFFFNPLFSSLHRNTIMIILMVWFTANRKSCSVDMTATEVDGVKYCIWWHHHPPPNDTLVCILKFLLSFRFSFRWQMRKKRKIKQQIRHSYCVDEIFSCFCSSSVRHWYL